MHLGPILRHSSESTDSIYPDASRWMGRIANPNVNSVSRLPAQPRLELRRKDITLIAKIWQRDLAVLVWQLAWFVVILLEIFDPTLTTTSTFARAASRDERRRPPHADGGARGESREVVLRVFRNGGCWKASQPVREGGETWAVVTTDNSQLLINILSCKRRRESSTNANSTWRCRPGETSDSTFSYPDRPDHP